MCLLRFDEQTHSMTEISVQLKNHSNTKIILGRSYAIEKAYQMILIGFVEGGAWPKA